MALISLIEKAPMITETGQYRSIPDRVHSITADTPFLPALHWDGQILTYEDLDHRSALVASHLVSRGACAGDIIGVCLDRAFGHIVACLAGMRIGCAFTLIDPGDPAERRRAILSDAGARVLVADAARAQGHEGDLLLIDHQGMVSGTDRHPTPMPDHHVLGDEVAYIVYTSGSTGVPKGVEITHANLANLVDWHIRRFAVGQGDRASHIAGLGFDAAIWEVWPYLAAGASVAIVDDTTRTSPSLLRDWMLRERITIGFVPPALAEPMIAEAWPQDCALRYMLTGGDALRARPLRDAPFKLVNNYGPCECTVVATSGEVAPIGSSEDVPDIGRPIDGVAVHILDDDGRPVPEGSEGEIWIGGKGVGRGYRNRPDLTTAAFAPDPFGDASGGMIYRTGDLGQWTADGRVLFRGRVDRQVKVRGIRIELDGIATTLQQHPAVASAVVMAREDGNGDRRLCAYYAPASGGDPGDDADLHAFLAARLPASHLPAAFVRIDAMPVTPNGKLDADALPEPPSPGDVKGGDCRAPGTPIEARLAAIVEGVLGTGGVPMDANFFMLGGHSLLATQVVIQSREAFDIDLSLRDLFDAPTIESFAAIIENRIAAKVATLSEDDVLRMLAVAAG